MKDKDKDQYPTQERFDWANVHDATVWAGHARPPIFQDQAWLFLMFKAREEADHIKLLAYYDRSIPALVIVKREHGKLVDWTAKALPDLTEKLARGFVAATAAGYGFDIQDVKFYKKIKTIRPPTLVK